MKKTNKLILAAMTACSMQALHAGTIVETKYITDDIAFAGVGSTYDRLDAPWSEDLSFNQFNMPGYQLDSATISYSLYLETTQYVRNLGTTRNAPSQAFKLDNTLSGGLLIGSSTLLSFKDAVNEATVPKGTMLTFNSFVLEDSGFITLTGSDLSPFLGSGTFMVNSFGNAKTEMVKVPTVNYLIATHSDGNAEVTVEYSFSKIPTPTPLRHVPDGGATFAMLGVGFIGLVFARNKQ